VLRVRVAGEINDAGDILFFKGVNPNRAEDA
jgi:hypothetical protein